MVDNELLNKEISLIQEIIKRLASNSFFIKGWSLTINAIVFTLLKERVFEINITLFFIIFVCPIILFWYLDGYYLRQERLYRKLYTWVVNKRIEGNNEYPYNLNANRFSKDVKNVFLTMFSQTLIIFYSIPSSIVIGLLIYKIVKL
jgi:hypothetical protein